MDKHRIFISYSRKDYEIIGPLVAFLRVSASDVFRDVDSIPPGLEWRAVLASPIEECSAFILFWCCHSAASEEVAKEYRLAIRVKKPLVPVCMDNTALPQKLVKHQGIDLRRILGPHEGMIEHQVAGMLPGPTQTIRTWGLIVPDGEVLRQLATHLKLQLVATLEEDK